MIFIQNSQVSRNFNHHILLIESQTPKLDTTWRVKTSDQILISLNSFPQADHNESTGKYRIEFRLEGDSETVFAIFTEGNQLFYTTDLQSFVADPDHQLLKADGKPLPALEDGSLQSIFFSISVNDDGQIWVVGDIENIAPILPPSE